MCLRSLHQLGLMGTTGMVFELSSTQKPYLYFPRFTTISQETILTEIRHVKWPDDLSPNNTKPLSRFKAVYLKCWSFISILYHKRADLHYTKPGNIDQPGFYSASNCSGPIHCFNVRYRSFG